MCTNIMCVIETLQAQFQSTEKETNDFEYDFIQPLMQYTHERCTLLLNSGFRLHSLACSAISRGYGRSNSAGTDGVRSCRRVQ